MRGPFYVNDLFALWNTGGQWLVEIMFGITSCSCAPPFEAMLLTQEQVLALKSN